MGGMGDHRAHWTETDVDSGPALDIDAILDLLAREVRRDVVDFCRCRENRHLRIDHLAERVAERARRRGEPVRTDRVEAALHHVHLPRLEEAGVLEYDLRNGDIRYAGDERLEACLDRITDL